MPEPSETDPLPSSEPKESLPPTDAAPGVESSGTIAQAAPSASALASGPATIQVAGYEVLSELGRGGMGAVFRGRDLELGRDLAIKVLLEGGQFAEEVVQRFLEEAQIGGQLQHPGVAPLYAIGRLSDNRPYFTMKLVQGGTLAALLDARRDPADDLPRFLKVFEQICQTLAYAHTRGVIHRDLKPLNIMVGAFGEVQVMDWGLAKVVKAGSVRTIRSEATDCESAGSIFGTPAYMAPEQARGDVEELNERSDVFGLGAILCEILTGAPPYRSRQRGSLLRHAAEADLTDAFERLEACTADAELVRLAKSCLAAEPADRPVNGGAVADAMTGYLAGVQERLRTAELEKAAAQARAIEECKRRRVIVALAATVLLALAGASAGALWYQQDRAVRAAEQARRAANTERDVTAALDESAALGAQARTLKDNPTRWEAALGEAMSAVKRAEGVLNGGAGTDELRRRVLTARQSLKADDDDRRMIARLEEARLQQAEAGQDGFDTAGSAALYAAAFEQDLKLSTLTPDQVAERINQRDIRDELLAALADWYSITPNKDEAEQLRVLLQTADPDPGSFRNRVKTFSAQKDWDSLRRLAASPETLNQPPTQLQYLGRQLKGVDAATFLRAASGRRPGDFWLTFQLAYTLQMLKPTPATDEAIGYYRAAVALRPDSPVVHNNLAVALEEKDRLDEAVAEYRKALELKPDYPNPHNGLGNVLRDQHRPQEAVAEYRKALELNPSYANPHIGLGNVLRDQGRLEDSIAEYQKAVELKPDYDAAHHNLGNALADKGRLDDAIAEYRKAIAFKADSAAAAQTSLGNVFRAKHQLNDAVSAYHKALELRPDYYLAHYNLGNVLADKNRLDEAVAEYRKAAELKPHFADAHLGLSVVFRIQGRLDDAVKEGRIAAGLSPTNASIHTMLGLALSAKGQADEAVGEYREAVQCDPKSADACYFLAVALGNKGETDEAIRQYHKAVELKPDYAEAHARLGAVLEDSGRLDDATTEYRKAVEIKPDYALAHVGLGFALRKQGRYSESLAAFRRAHQLGSKNRNWILPSAAWVRAGEELARADALLPIVLRKEAEPSTPEVGLLFFEVCSSQRRYADAVRFAARSFAAKPALAEDQSNGYRYSAACAAALGGSGIGANGKAEEKDRAAMRKLALDWLRLDLDLWTKKISVVPKGRDAARRSLQRWRKDSALADVRDKAALSQLPAGEQDGWRKLWSDVDVLLKRTAP